MARWDLNISSRPTYWELKVQHERWLSRQHHKVASLSNEHFLRWTPERVAIVREMRQARKPFKIIARALGPTFNVGMVAAEWRRISAH